MLHQYGYYKIAAAIPAVKIGNVQHNQAEIIRSIRQAAESQISLLAFPELCLTGATCGQLFNQKLLQDACHTALTEIAAVTENLFFPVIIGSPVMHQGKLFNCAVVISGGQVRGIIPKLILNPEEKRYFSAPADDFSVSGEAMLNGCSAPFGNSLLFAPEGNRDFCFAVEMGEDYKNIFSPSTLSLYTQATVIVNPAALPAKVGFLEQTEQRLRAISRSNHLAYLHIGSSLGESSTYHAFAGQAYLAENGKILSQSTPYSQSGQLITGLIDAEKASFLKRSEVAAVRAIPGSAGVFLSCQNILEYPAKPAAAENGLPLLPLLPRFPFIPDDAARLERNCREVIDITVSACIQRFRHVQNRTAVIGISGGLDSTLALLFLAEAYRRMEKPLTEIVGVRMPGFGTSGQTYENSCQLMQLLGISQREINIKAAVLQHLQDIEHPANQQDTTYENAQARERTQILMDIANQTGGLVIGTGDLSELALGFCTYNGDHMSMYSLNASIPKTLIPYIIRSLGRSYADSDLRAVLESIIDTPISPELLPPTANQQILQKTEELIGPYALHDFFLYYMIKYGFSPKKIRALAVKTFAGDFDAETVNKWLKVFYRRFFAQQFKRNCLPDGPSVSNVSLAAAFSMPSDASAALWLTDLEEAL